MRKTQEQKQKENSLPQSKIVLKSQKLIYCVFHTGGRIITRKMFEIHEETNNNKDLEMP